MRSRVAVIVPVTSTRWRLATRHHASSRVGGSRWPGHARCTPEYPAMAGHDGLRRRGRRCASRQSAPSSRLSRYGMSPGPSGYLASEQLT